MDSGLAGCRPRPGMTHALPSLDSRHRPDRTARHRLRGQPVERALVDVATHRRLLDAYAGLEDDATAVARLWGEQRVAQERVAAHRARVEQARREADWLRHAADELTKLKPETGEETALA